MLERLAPLRASTVKACGSNAHSTALHAANQSKAQIRASDEMRMPPCMYSEIRDHI